MSQNQTIDGVPRKSLEQALKLAAVFDDGGDGADAESARGVVWILRALLDAPAVSLADEGEMPAAQPQGEPVYMKPQYLSVPGLWIECKEGEIHAKPFYAEQPAPVAVVMPEQLIAAIEAEQERLSQEDYLMDSEDCVKVIREEVTRLNTK